MNRSTIKFPLPVSGSSSFGSHVGSPDGATGRGIDKEISALLGYDWPVQTPCKIWNGSKSKRGYGFDGHKSAHALAWERKHGPIPVGLIVCHKCDNPPCVNVDHLFIGTDADNIRDAKIKGRYRGENNGRAKLTADQVLEIRSLGNKLSLTELAKRFSVNRGTLHNILHRKNWKHI